MQRVFVHCREKVDGRGRCRQRCGDRGSRYTARMRRAMIALCRGAKIPSRPVAGFVIETGDNAAAQVWVEVLMGDRWIAYDPVNGYERELPTNFVPARHGDDRVMITTGMRNLDTAYEITPLPGHAGVYRDRTAVQRRPELQRDCPGNAACSVPDSADAARRW